MCMVVHVWQTELLLASGLHECAYDKLIITQVYTRMAACMCVRPRDPADNVSHARIIKKKLASVTV